MGDLIHEVFNHGNEAKEKRYTAVETLNEDGTINIELPIDEIKTDCILAALRTYVAYLHMPKKFYWPLLEEEIEVHKKLLLNCDVITDSGEVTGRYNGKYSEFYPEYDEYMDAHMLDMWDLNGGFDVADTHKKGLDWLEKFEEKWDLDNKNLGFKEIMEISKKIK